MIVHLYIDGDNLFYLQKDDLGWRLDFEKLLEFCKRYGELEKAAYYIGAYKSDSLEKKAFFSRLVGFGYEIVAKPVKEMVNEDGEIYYKSNLDMVMLRDICLNFPYYDMAMIVTGDGDFDCVLETFRATGKRFKIISTKHFSSSVLKAVAGMDFVDIKDYRSDLELSIESGWLAEESDGEYKKPHQERPRLPEGSERARAKSV